MVGLFGVSRAHALADWEFAAFQALASPGRRERAGRFLRREDASRALVAEALLRLAARAAGSDLDGATLHLNRYGKPFVADAGFEFNLAHSGEWVICATDAEEIGVDVERHHEIGSGIAEHFFSRAENAFLAGLAQQAARLRAFFDIWSLKESYIKAIGKGLSCPLDGFACLPSASGSIGFHPFDGGLPRRHFQLVDLRPGYSCALCTAAREPVPAPRLFSPAELLSALRA